MPEGKYIEQKKQSFDDLTFAMRLLWTKKIKRNYGCWVKRKNPKP